MDTSSLKKSAALFKNAAIINVVAIVVVFLFTVFGLSSIRLIMLIVVGALAAVVLAIISVVQNIRGANTAANDEPYFKTILAVIIIDLVGKIASAFFASSNPSIEAVINLICKVLEIYIIFGVIHGYGKVFAKIGNEDLVKAGKASTTVIAACLAASAIVSLIVDLLSARLPYVLILIFGIVQIVLGVFGYFKYIGYLNKAEKNL